MKNILRFHWADLRSLGGSAFALLIVLAACVIPALYAWFNIYSNWDPYGATGNIPIAVCSRDEGYAPAGGEQVNCGRDIVDELTASDSIRWVEMDSETELAEAVRAGRYYAGLVLSPHLSRNMYDVTAALTDPEPSVVFYQNAKTNAVANKITETAAEAAEHSIQNKYLTVFVETGFAELEELLVRSGAEDSRDSLLLILADLRDGLGEYASLTASLGDVLGGFSSQLTGVDDLSLPEADLTAAEQLSAGLEQALLPRVEEISGALTALRQQLAEAAAGESLSDELRQGLLAQAASLSGRLRALSELLPSRGLVAQAAARALTELARKTDELSGLISQAEPGDAGLEQLAREGDQLLGDMEELVSGSLLPGLQQLFDNAGRELELLQRLLDAMAAGGQTLQPALAEAAAALETLDGSAGRLTELLRSSSTGVEQLIAELSRPDRQELADSLISFLHGDPAEFASFLTSPVEVSSSTLYPVDTYGSAMAPFYSTLAIWVGCVVLVAILRVEGRRLPLPGVSENQALCGRFLLFVLLSQIQTAIIILGDVFLLHVQCMYLFRFWLCAAVTSLVFVTLIYGLVLAFGDVGKAVVVVVMILQIAGSGGTFPIEILPDIFSRIYLFFPYPYAINAMREAMFGPYGQRMAVCLAELLPFAALGLLAWLGARRPNAGVLRFMEEEMEETGVL